MRGLPKRNGGRHRQTPRPAPDREAALFSSDRQWLHRDMHLALRPAGERHRAVDQRKDGVVAAEADILARMPLGAALADQDVAGNHLLAAELLDTEAPAFSIT